MLGPGLSKLQKVDNLVTCVFATSIQNAGPRVLQKVPGKGWFTWNFIDVLIEEY